MSTHKLLAVVLVVSSLWLAHGSASLKDVVVQGNTVGRFLYDPEDTTKKLPGYVWIAQDGLISDDTIVEAKSFYDSISAAGRIMVVDIYKIGGYSKTSMADMTADEMTKSVDAAIGLIKTCEYCASIVEPTQIAVIGTGYGGNAAILAAVSESNFAAAIAFTPVLSQLPTFDSKKQPKAKLLVLPAYGSIGDLDAFEKNIETLTKSLVYEVFIQYNTKMNFNLQKSNDYLKDQTARAMTQVKSFCSAAFNNMYQTVGTTDPSSTPMNGITVEDVKYMDGDVELQSSVYRKTGTNQPAVIVVPGWNGISAYELGRVRFLAEMGYVAMAANIFGLPPGVTYNSSVNDLRIAATSQWRTANDDAKGRKFADRIAAAHKFLLSLTYVNPKQVSIIGFCFGGTGVYNSYRYGLDMKVHSSFHGHMMQTRNFSTVLDAGLKGYLTMYAGTLDGGESGTTLVAHLADLSKYGGRWEVTRYSDTPHSFTDWTQAAYRPWADGRSFESLARIMQKEMPLSSSASRHTSAGVMSLIALITVCVTFWSN